MKQFNDKNKYINIYNDEIIEIAGMPRDAVVNIVYRDKGLVNLIETIVNQDEVFTTTTDNIVPVIDKNPTIEIYYNGEDENGEEIRKKDVFFLEYKSPFVTDLTNNLNKEDAHPEFEALKERFLNAKERADRLFVENDQVRDELAAEKKKHTAAIAAKDKEIASLKAQIKTLEEEIAALKEADKPTEE